MDNDSVPLKDLGIVNGDLIYVIPARDSEQHGDNPGNQYADFLADQHPFQHSPERGESLQVINMINHIEVWVLNKAPRINLRWPSISRNYRKRHTHIFCIP